MIYMLFFRAGLRQKSPSVVPIDIDIEPTESAIEADLVEDIADETSQDDVLAGSEDVTEVEIAETEAEMDVEWADSPDPELVDDLATDGESVGAANKTSASNTEKTGDVETKGEDGLTEEDATDLEDQASNLEAEDVEASAEDEDTEVVAEGLTESEEDDLEETIAEDTEDTTELVVNQDEEAEDAEAEDTTELAVNQDEDAEEAIAKDESELEDEDDSETVAKEDDEEETEPVLIETNSEFNSGVFTVGASGEVTIDFLFDGGKYKGELAIFSLNGMGEFEPGSEDFIREAASRALSNSTSGYVVISDPTEGAKFSGELGDKNYNSESYQGAKTFTMEAGDQFGFMLVANGRVQQVFDNPNVGGALRPLFSMATANPDDAFHVGQIADVTGDGNTFVMEDMRVDGGSDRDYNDIIFQVRGATGSAVHLDEVIDPAKDWRNTDLGQIVIGNTTNIVKTEDINPVDEQPIQDDPVTENPVDEQPVPFDQELWDFITGQESPADPLPEGVELPNNQQPTWVKQLGSVELDRSRGIAVDSSGNVYVAGGTLGSLDGNTSAIGVNGSSDPFLTKYDINGNKLWTKQLGSTGWDYYNAVTVDNTGNVYTVGYDDGPNTSGGGDATFTKWDSNGNRLWSKSIGSSQSQDFASDVTVDSTGNILITGMNDRSIGVVGGNADAFVAKYNSNGNEVWTRQLGTALQDQARSVTTDAAGNVYIAGITEGSLDGNISAGGTDVFVSKYDPSGNKIWTRQLGTASSDGYVSYAGNGEFERNVSIAVDSTGSVYVSGTTEGSLDGNVNSGGRDAFITKYDSFGTKNWTRQLGTAGEDRSMGVAVDGTGTVYISGWTTGNLDGKTNSGSTDAFVTRYDSLGNKILTLLLGTTAVDASRDVAVDRTGNVYISGWTESSLGGTAAGNLDTFIAKYAPLQPNRSPIVTFSSRTVDIGATTNTDFFTVTDPDGDVIQQYMFADNNGSNTSGYFTLNGIKQTATFSVAASQLATVKFVAGSQVGSDSVSVYAYDGKTWGANTGTITTVQPNRAAGINISNRTFDIGTTTAASNLFTVSDPDGDTIQSYYFQDGNDSSTSGYFTLNGNRQTGAFFVTASQLANVKFVAGSQAANDLVTVYANDGKVWSSSSATMTTKQANRAPLVSALNQTVNINQSMSPVFNVSDPDGDTISRYWFADNNASSTSGYFTVDGVRISTSFGVEASKLNTVKFVGGSVAGTDNVTVWAWDGQTWGSNSFNIDTKQANRAPIVTTTNRTINTGTITNADFFTVSDPDGDAIQSYYFYDNNSSTTSGYFTLNGVKQATGFSVTASQLASVKFVGGSQAGSDSVSVYASDGKTWSNGANSILTTQQANQLPIVKVSNQSVNANQSVNLAFTATDPDGDAITRYQFWDSNTDSSSGYFTVNGVRQPAGQAIEVAANQLNTVRFVGSSLAGNDSLWIRAFDNKDWSNWQNFSMTTTANQNPQFTSFNVTDASGDSTANTVFQGGAIRFNYNLANSANLSSVRLEAVRNGSVIANLGTWNGASESDKLINLANFSNLTGGDYQIRAVARTTSGQEVISSAQSMKVLSTNRVDGTFAGETLTYAGGLGTGGVIIGRGGTDTLNLSGISRSSVTGINGMSLSSFNPWSGSTNSQAIFGGNALDYITLADGREVYFQGIDRLRFSDGSEMSLQIRPNDTSFAQQWNLQITDVTSAWRFTQGSSSVLLSSLDSGLTPPTSDINSNRLILRSNGIDNDDFNDYGHGAVATSVMASTTNNSSGVAGINWNSQVIVNDLYGGDQRVNRVSLFEAINSSIKAARTTGKKIVFQGGVQGEEWLNNFQTLGATQAQLEQLIRDNSDIALFAVAAGNGGPGGEPFKDPNYLTSVSGVAKLETNHSNVISVGALTFQANGTDNRTWVNNLINTSAVDIASYSNRGSNLTLVAPTDSPAMNKFGNMQFFGGTSAANPNMAGIASLVWSVNSKLTGGQVRQILIDTAMDLGTAGRDNTFGNGLVNADAAVRRAWALQKDSQVANLYSGRSVIA